MHLGLLFRRPSSIDEHALTLSEAEDEPMAMLQLLGLFLLSLGLPLGLLLMVWLI